MPVKNKTRIELIMELTYIRDITIYQCKLCGRIFTNMLDCKTHQGEEHTDKEFEKRF